MNCQRRIQLNDLVTRECQLPTLGRDIVSRALALSVNKAPSPTNLVFASELVTEVGPKNLGCYFSDLVLESLFKCECICDNLKSSSPIGTALDSSFSVAHATCINE